MGLDMPKFQASESCFEYPQLLHYTNFNVMKKILDSRTLKCNSLKHVNDRFERQRKGIEDLMDGYYVSCFCHNQYEIVPFWFMYGGASDNNRKVLLRLRNFSKDFENAIESDWAFTDDGKCIFFDPKRLFSEHLGGMSFSLVDDPNVEKRQTIKHVRLFDVDYQLPEDDVFSKGYKTMGRVSFGEGQDAFPAAIKDARSIGKQKTIHWKYEDETRIQCMMDPIGSCYHDFILLRVKDEIFREAVIVANPWASDEFIEELKSMLNGSTLPGQIKDTITIQRSELDGQITER